MINKTVEKLPIDVEKNIRSRVSIRNYEDKNLTPEDKRKLMDFNETLTNPFGVPVKIQYLSTGSGAQNVKLGTYGTIKGARDYLAITVKDEPYNMEAVGYQFENLVLYATDMGLGTVWLAATFSRKDFEKAMDISDSDLFPCISPIGYPASKSHLLERITRKTLGSSGRKPWDTMFFNENFECPLTETDAGDYAVPLEMVRLAPSSTNGQPWVVLKEGDTYHFFARYKEGTADDVVMIKRVDLGIALSHFHQSAISRGMDGVFEEQNVKAQIPKDMHYIVSYTCR